MKVSDLMTTDVVVIGPETPLRDVAAILAERSISGLPVVSERGLVLGVVSEADILVKERGARPPRGRLRSLFDRRGDELEPKVSARTAAEAMTTPAVTIGPGRSVAAAAGLMLERSVNRLPVVDGRGALVGIVTRADLVRAFARPDEEIEREIRQDVLKKTFWLPLGTVKVGSTRGEVTLEGHVEHRYEAELLPDVVRRVPGVVSVTSRLTWPPEPGGGRETEAHWPAAMGVGFGPRRDGQ